MNVQVVVLLDPNSSDPYEVLGLLPEEPTFNHFDRMERAIDFTVKEFQEIEDITAKEENREAEQVTREWVFEREYGIETFVMPVTGTEPAPKTPENDKKKAACSLAMQQDAFGDGQEIDITYWGFKGLDDYTQAELDEYYESYGEEMEHYRKQAEGGTE